ncbi:large subunit ribosomal protein L7/L12 [Streptomyces canus]|uniref:ribosomal protein L7/L12 n=1 Tax=Streptomyces canus TaxID=58343 RepID=UPI002782FACC|nr:ribosomal protein L7/L12 [Streptomyces canus]MDQ0604214.1 large subunit ribosomal protein L7/L12 [Streptomyces canus]
MAEPVTYAVLICDDEPYAALLTQVGGRSLDVVRVVRRLTGLSLSYSKLLVSRAPVIVLDGLPRDMAEAAVSDLVAAGAEAEVRAGSWTGLPASGDSLG